MTTRQTCLDRDASDPLAVVRDRFSLPEGLIYLDGNSLGALPHAAAARLVEAAVRQWGQDLISSWNSHGWIGLPQQVGSKIARLIGAAPRQRGRSEACRFRHPWAGALSTSGGKMRP